MVDSGGQDVESGAVNRPTHTVSIERLALTDLDLTPVEAERLRVEVADELQRLLERGGGLGDLPGGEVHQLEAPAVPLTGPASSSRLTDGLAQSVARALQGVGRAHGGV